MHTKDSKTKKSIIKKTALLLYFVTIIVLLFFSYQRPQDNVYSFSVLFLISTFVVGFWIWGTIYLISNFYKKRREIKDNAFALGEIIWETSLTLLGIIAPIIVLLFFLGLLSTLTIKTLLIIVIVLLVIVMFLILLIKKD